MTEAPDRSVNSIGRTMPQRKLRSFRSATKSKKKTASAAKAARGCKVAGTTADGIRILRAKVKPKHFTSRQIRLGPFQCSSAVGLGSTGGFMQQLQNHVTCGIQLSAVHECRGILTKRHCRFRL